MKTLRRIYLCVHPLIWLDIVPGDPRRQTPLWEQWPGRCSEGYRRDHQLKPHYEALVRGLADKNDEAVFVLPTTYQGCSAYIRFIQETLGPRAVVCDFGCEATNELMVAHMRELLGDGFFAEIEADVQQAVARRNLSSADELLKDEIRTWQLAKASAYSLNRQAEAQGYTYDPQTVEMIAYGQDWHGCCCTYPLYMAAVFGLGNPIQRRFDLIAATCAPVLVFATSIAQNVPLPEDRNISLFIHQTEDGRYAAQFFFGRRAIMDRPRQVQVDFGAEVVKEVNLWGYAITRSLGAYSRPIRRVAMRVGSGTQTSHWSTLVMAEAGVPLADFRAALLAGRVADAPEPYFKG